jgi:hypothetical protein
MKNAEWERCLIINALGYTNNGNKSGMGAVAYG